MKQAARRARALRAGFIRGCVASGLLAVVEERAAGRHITPKRLVRRALQGGSALATGTAAADALTARRPAAALGAVAAGLAALWSIERLLSPINVMEKPHGQEETCKSIEEGRLDTAGPGDIRRLGR